MRRKRRKLKKIFRLVILLIILLLIITIFYLIKPNKQTNPDKINYIDNILDNTKDEFITKDFLKWIEEKYDTETLKKLNEYINNNSYDNNTWHEITGYSYTVLKDLYNKTYDNMTNISFIKDNDSNTISFVGDVSLADNWYIIPKYDERKKGIYGILSEEVVDIMTKSSIMVVNNEFTISNRGEKIPGKTYTFRANPQRLSIYEEMGVDLLTLANNHVYDFGEVAFNDMIDSLNEYKIPYIGAGKNIEEAKKPYYFILDGYKFAFINATRAEKNIKTPEATDTKSGVFRCYDPVPLINEIKKLKEKSDYVIALIHWGKEDSHELEEEQVSSAKQYIEAGADVIVGTHAHELQGIEFHNNKPIIYNIGDFIFNNENKDTGIFQIKINSDNELEYYFIPAYQANEYTKLLHDSDKQRVINNMNSWSINAKINDNNKIEQTK